MSSLFWTAFGVQWLLLVILFVLVILLYRQFGLMIMPGSQRVGYGGLDVGARAPAVSLRFADERDVAYDWTPRYSDDLVRTEATLALFAFSSCHICDELADDQRSMAQLAQRHPSVRFLWIEELSKSQPHAVADGWTLARSPGSGAHGAMEVPGTPFAYLISAEARILAKALINHPANIEDIVAAARLGSNTTAAANLA
jgi:hypothetical protein